MKANKSRPQAGLQTMRCTKPNAGLVWRQVDDLLVPRLRLDVADRAAYCYLLRHSRLEGKLRIRFSMPWLGRGICLSSSASRRAVRRLIEQKALRLVECSTAGRVAEVLLPEEILADHLDEMASRPGAAAALHVDLEKEDFLRTKALRGSIHAREGGRCFYCLKRHTPWLKCLDHVVPRTQGGNNSYRNLVSCCRECNSLKGQCRADDFLRSLFRDRKLTESGLAGRLGALDAFAAGKLPPPLPSAAMPPRTPALRAPSQRPRPGIRPDPQISL